MKSSCKVALALLVCFLLGMPGARAGTVVQFRTTLGNFDVELFDKDKPITVGNFLRYVTNGIYNDMFMHRGVTNFVIQGGGFRMTGRGTASPAIDYLSVTYASITNEFLTGKFFGNTYGTIAMAKTSDPNSATSQFFLNLGNNAASLDNPANSGGFTVFGRVISGTNILNRFNPGPGNTFMKLVSLGAYGGGAFQELPVLSTATTTLTDLDFLYVNTVVVITNGFTFPAQLTSSGNQRLISWTSVKDVTNYVDFTASTGGVWQTLIATNGDGNRYTVTNTVPGGTGSRFYRVRIGYGY